MDGNTLERLLAWMQAPENNVMHGWGAIAILGRKKVNELLAQQHVTRSSAYPWLPLISGVVDTIAGKRLDAICGFRLDAPQLSFENADLDSDHATLSCSVTAGAWLTMSRRDNQWQIQRIVEIDPLLGPRVVLDLYLTKTPGSVSDDGRIILDLKDSDEVRLTGAGTEDEQLLVGNLFKSLISQLPDDQRIWEIARIETENAALPLMKPASFRLQVKADPQASMSAETATDREGAVLVCINMVDRGQGGTLPADYPYFIPDDTGKDYSASVLMPKETVLAAMLASLAHIYGKSDFELTNDADGTLLQAQLTSGVLNVPSHLITQTDPDTGEETQLLIHEMAFELTPDLPATVAFGDDGIQMTWSSRSITGMTFTTEPAESFYRFGVDVVLHAAYQLIDGHWTNTAYTFDKNIIALPPTAGEKNAWDDMLGAIGTLMSIVNEAITNMLTGHVDPLFQQTFPVESSFEDFLNEQLTLGFGQFVQSDTLHVPKDVLILGHVNPKSTSFVVSPLQPLMMAGSSQSFVTQPTLQNLAWSVEALEGGSVEKGCITPAGLYQSPHASALDGQMRVRVVAEDRATGHSSAALVTVLASPLTVSPLVQVCSTGETVELAANGFANEPLQWAIANPVSGESGSVRPSTAPGGDHTYVAGPKVSEKTYVLDEIKVSGPSGARSAWILVVQKTPVLVVKPRVNDASTGQASLQALWSGAEIKPVWTLPLGGPGSIDADGKYQAPDNIQDRFALVLATYSDAMFGDVEGHIILPLPLSDFKDELTLMGEDAAPGGLLSLSQPKASPKQSAPAADTSLEGLVEWMADPANNVMWDWDAIAAMDRSSVNSLLLQEYIHRFSSDTYLPAVSGQVPTVNNEWIEAIHGFLLDAPRLAFVNDDLGDSHASLTCAILGGIQRTLHKNVDSWDVVKLTRFDPLQGPRLTLDLRLDQVAGLVEDDGRVRLDLQHSDNFILTFAESEYEKKLGGDFFKDLFNQLPDEQRIWTLGTIGPGSNTLMRAESFKLRTQTRPQGSSQAQQTASNCDGAILTFICMEDGSTGGDIPIEYRYLIPDEDSGRYGATVLFAEGRINKAAKVIETVTALVSSAFEYIEFDYIKDADGRVTKATARTGQLLIPSASKDLLPVFLDGKYVTPRVFRTGASYDAHTVSMPLTITLDGNRNAVLTWQAEAREGVTLEFPDSIYPVFVAVNTIAIEVTCHYLFSDDDNDLVLKPTLDLRVRSEEGELSFESLEGIPVEDYALLLTMGVVALGIVSWDKTRMGTDIQALLAKVLQFRLPVSAFIEESIQLNFNHAIVSDVFRAPRDIALFGRIAPAATRFVVSPQEHLMTVDSAMKFATEPAGMQVDWSVEKLHGASEDAGAISAMGKYYAPQALSKAESFIRLRITATDQATSHQSSALVTVVASPVSLNPLIQVCDNGQSVELAVGVTGIDDATCAIKNPVEGESGTLSPSTLTDSGYTYTASSADVRKTYVLDEIVFANQDFSTSAWVLVQKNTPFLTIKATIAEQDGTSAEKVLLQAIGNGNVVTATWSMPLGGPGSITDGVYSAGEEADKHFVLILATVQHVVMGELQGHIILSLPLASHFS
ncbi:hypothetical protein G7013_18470 [Pseudomonas viridiflava]|uniref:hypothetical protein n=1 Tax=Pseudomonas viridiflava TaxID=33069 RepID=UPI0015E3C993|nr:hypothetical protein [Pseudomonas viridiflava]MBA1231633.1 hypothetical protein [Pseudomonas viridiflava]